MQDDPVALQRSGDDARPRARDRRARRARYAEAPCPSTRERTVSCFSRAARRHARERRPRGRACSSPAAGVRRRAASVRPPRVRAPDPPARARRRPDRRRALRRAGRRPGPRRARPARASVRAHAPAPRPARARAPGVHRQRVARAADADLLARRASRAARRRGPRRGDAARVPGDDAGAGRAAAEARDRPARPVAARRRPAAPRARAVELEPSRLAWSTSSRPLAQASGHILESTLERRRRRSATSCACCRSAGPGRERAPAHARRGPRSRSRAERATTRSARRRGRRARDPARARRTSSSASTASTARASGSGLGLAIARELAELMGGALELAEPGRTRFRCAAGPRGAPRENEPRLATVSRENGRPSTAATVSLRCARVPSPPSRSSPPRRRPASLVAAIACSASATTTTTVLRRPAAPGPTATSRSRRRARPLPGNGFDPGGSTPRAAAASSRSTRSSGDAADAPATARARASSSRRRYVLTNAHVITNAARQRPRATADEVFVEFRDGDRVPAEWSAGTSSTTSACYARSGGPRARAASRSATRQVAVGEPVAAIGSPFGHDSLAVGVVSATRRSIPALTSEYQLVDAIQTDAPINRGNSGGPLFDARGRVIGINAQIRSESGDNEGVGFAVPINAARRSMRSCSRTARSPTRTSASHRTSRPSLARRIGVLGDRGASWSRVADGSPAARRVSAAAATTRTTRPRFASGGDVVVAIDGGPCAAATTSSGSSRAAPAGPGRTFAVVCAAAGECARRRGSPSGPPRRRDGQRLRLSGAEPARRFSYAKPLGILHGR